MKSSDAKASKCHLKFSSRMIIFIKLVYLSSVISLKLQWLSFKWNYWTWIYKLDKNYHSRRKFQMALRGFCIWTLQIY